METIEQLRKMRSELPKGKKDPWGHGTSKRILLMRVLGKDSLTNLTAGEQDVVQEWVAYVKKFKQDAVRFEKSILKTLQ